MEPQDRSEMRHSQGQQSHAAARQVVYEDGNEIGLSQD